MNKQELLRQKRIHGLPEIVSLQELIQLKRQMPIQKIIGFIQFDKIKINVNKHVLIPRYETQEVVQKALEFIGKNDKVLDLCCGSGYIGLTIKNKSNAQVTCADIADDAIEQTRENALLNNLDINIVKSDLLKNINGIFDLVIANPPYLPRKEKLSNSVLKYEPHAALFAKRNGNYFYIKILKNIKKYLKPGGVLIFEIGASNVSYLQKKGFKILNDINQKARIAFKRY